MSKALVTTDHDEIREWVETRGGFPARVKRTGSGKKGGDAGLLRIDYPGFSGTKSLEKISWDDWFATFDSEELAFLHQDEIGRGKTSRFSKLVAREAARGTRAASGRNGTKAKAASARAKSTTTRPKRAAKKVAAKKATARKSAPKTGTARRGATTGSGRRTTGSTSRSKTSSRRTGKTGARTARA